MIRINGVQFTVPQLLVVIATLAGTFLSDIAGDLDTLGVAPVYVNIATKFLTALLGFALFLKAGPDGA